MKPIYSTIDPVFSLPRRVSLADKPATARLKLSEVQPAAKVSPIVAVIANVKASREGVACLCGGDAWVAPSNKAAYTCAVCARMISYADMCQRKAALVSSVRWPPTATGIVESLPPEERWRGDVLWLGRYDLAPNEYGALRFTPHGGFLPKRFRITASGPGVRVQVAIQDRFQYRPANNYFIAGPEGGVPQDLFAEDAVNDDLDPIQRQAKVEVFTYNSSHERRIGYVWFEGEKIREVW